MVRKTTKELLAESFKELAEQKPINKITIANIADNCGVTQPTFYRYYKDKYDLIAWIYVTDSEKIMGQIGSNGYIWKDTLLDAARYFSENRAFALNALRHTSGRDAFLNLLETVNTEHNKRIWSEIVSAAADCVFSAVFWTAGAIQEAMCNAWQFRKECIRWEEARA